MARATLRRRLDALVPVLVILLLGFGLRVTLLGDRSVWYDEAFSVFLSEKSIADIIRGTSADIQPPLYYLLLHFWQALGAQAFTLRFLSVAFSILSLALVYRLVAGLFSRRAAVFAAIMAAVAPFQIQYAQELRMYSLLEFLLLLHVYALARLEAAGNETLIWLVLSGSGVAAIYTQNLALLTLAVPLAYAVYRRNMTLLRAALAGLVAVLVLYVPWLAVLASQLQSIQRSYWIAPPGLAEVVQFLLSSTTNLPLPDWMLPFALFVTLLATLLVLAAMGRGNRLATQSGYALLVALWIIPPVFILVVSYALRSVFVVRGLIASSTALTALIGCLIAQQRHSGTRIAVAVITLILIAPSLYFQLSYDHFPRSPYDRAAAYLDAAVQPGDVIVHDNKMTYFPMRFYDRDLAQTWIADPPDAGSNTLAPATMSSLDIWPTGLAQAAAGKSRIWFVVFERALSEAAAQGRVQGNVDWMDTNYTQVRLERFNDLYVYLYEK